MLYEIVYRWTTKKRMQSSQAHSKSCNDLVPLTPFTTDCPHFNLFPGCPKVCGFEPSFHIFFPKRAIRLSWLLSKYNPPVLVLHIGGGGDPIVLDLATRSYIPDEFFLGFRVNIGVPERHDI